MLRDELMAHLHDVLQPEKYQDYCPNGLQVEGKQEIKKIVSGVSASQAFLDAAVAEKADAVLVHHGYFWKGENSRVIGMKRARLKTLLEHNINLIAYHLPLDGQPEYGNNAQLAKLLNIKVTGDMNCKYGEGVGLLGELENSMTGQEFARHIESKLHRKPLHIVGSDKPIKSLAWCSGGGQDLIELAASFGVNAFFTGEASEQTVHVAREYGLHFFAIGHHASERYGVKALGEHLAAKFGVETKFLDIDNPV